MYMFYTESRLLDQPEGHCMARTYLLSDFVQTNNIVFYYKGKFHFEAIPLYLCIA